MFDKMRKGASLLMLAGLAVVTSAGSPAGAASSQPAVSAPATQVAAPVGPWRDEWGAPMAVLYNQLDNPGGSSISSQNFEAAYDAYDTFGGDDFVIPANTSWTIKAVGINGVYYGCTPPACGPAASFNVLFHRDNAGLPLDPAAATRASQAYTESPVGTFRITLNPPLTIPASPTPRKVWVSVQANLDFGLGGQFGWTSRSVLSNSAAAWKNPNGGFGVCPVWAPMAGCTLTLDPDFQFGLLGTHTP